MTCFKCYCLESIIALGVQGLCTWEEALDKHVQI